MKNNEDIPNTTLKRASEIYFSAMEIESDEEREAFVENACGNDAEVRHEVDSLFDMQHPENDIFKRHSPARISAAEIVNAIPHIPEFLKNLPSALPDDDEIGKQIGPYKLLQKIGEGGGGNVYLAEQTKPVRRQVALKIIKLGMNTRSVIARFEAERQALAMMEHPNIAHVLNAGETEKGRPYFVMELVNGKRITTYCDENELNIRQRLKLFVPICNAIQHAHQKGIIHRDIKPSNVLITEFDGVPNPIVIDFGIAKATEGDLLTDKTFNTAMGPLIGTPAYMSPEQTNLTQVDIDTRSDIYSLGVLLYELLISTPPFDQEELLKSGIETMCRTLREREPPTPSDKLRSMNPEQLQLTARKRNMDPKRLFSMLTGDLNWIVMKAMEKERARRYESASELALEIEHVLNDEPVMARPPSRLYRFRKLARRNKMTFASLTITVMALLGGLGSSTWLFIRERQARHSESRLRDEANARAKISQAALLLNRNQPADADRLVESIGTARIGPSMEAADVYRTLGEWNVQQEKWKKAAERFERLVYVNRVNRSDFREQMTRDLMSAASALAVAGKTREYRHFINEYLIHSAKIKDPVIAGQIITASLLLPADPEILQHLEPYREVVKSSLKDTPGNRTEISHFAWRNVALVLLEYRSGDAVEALRLGQNGLNYPIQTPARTALTHILLAMSYTKLNQPINARVELALGRKAINSRFPNDLKKVAELEGFKSPAWHEWLIGHQLLHEAEPLVEKTAIPPHT